MAAGGGGVSYISGRSRVFFLSTTHLTYFCVFSAPCPRAAPRPGAARGQWKARSSRLVLLRLRLGLWGFDQPQSCAKTAAALPCLDRNFRLLWLVGEKRKKEKKEEKRRGGGGGEVQFVLKKLSLIY